MLKKIKIITFVVFFLFAKNTYSSNYDQNYISGIFSQDRLYTQSSSYIETVMFHIFSNKVYLTKKVDNGVDLFHPIPDGKHLLNIDSVNFAINSKKGKIENIQVFGNLNDYKKKLDKCLYSKLFFEYMKSYNYNISHKVFNVKEHMNNYSLIIYEDNKQLRAVISYLDGSFGIIPKNYLFTKDGKNSIGKTISIKKSLSLDSNDNDFIQIKNCNITIKPN